MVLTINVAVLLAVILFFLLRRKVQARSRGDQMVTMALAVAFGVVVAPTDFGHSILNAVGQLAEGITDSGSP
ncbi:hypothetical protein ABZ953_13500 [Streptomyces sp. NPDC046465]|uniref:hypothetical protein n=1 Tax=Streptomyces sp. NPDC046465 TaxID=3155810 RepID=UPI0033E15ED0